MGVRKIEFQILQREKRTVDTWRHHAISHPNLKLKVPRSFYHNRPRTFRHHKKLQLCGPVQLLATLALEYVWLQGQFKRVVFLGAIHHEAV